MPQLHSQRKLLPLPWKMAKLYWLVVNGWKWVEIKMRCTFLEWCFKLTNVFWTLHILLKLIVKKGLHKSQISTKTLFAHKMWYYCGPILMTANSNKAINRELVFESFEPVYSFSESWIEVFPACIEQIVHGTHWQGTWVKENSDNHTHHIRSH